MTNQFLQSQMKNVLIINGHPNKDSFNFDSQGQTKVS